MERFDIFVRNLKNIMVKYGFKTQKELANKLGCSEPTVSNVIMEKTIPSMKFILSVCDAFDIGIDTLFIADEKQFGNCVDNSNQNTEELVKLLKNTIESKNNEIEELTDKISKLEHDINIYDLSRDILDDKVELVCSKDGLFLKKNNASLEVVDNEFKVDYLEDSGQYAVTVSVCVDSIKNDSKGGF